MNQTRRQLSREEILGWARRQQPEPEKHSQTAMERLPEEFQELRQCKDGKSFLSLLGSVMSLYRHTGGLRLIGGECRKVKKDPALITPHIVFGLSQLAHDLRDQVSPSRRKSFGPAIARLLQAKEKMDEKQGGELVELIFKIVFPDEHRWGVECNQREIKRLREGYI